MGIEAFANIKPVIGSNTGGIRDWVQVGETGWLFQPADPFDLASKIDSALEDPPRLRDMGEAAYQRVPTYYNQELYVARLLKICKRGVECFCRSGGA